MRTSPYSSTIIAPVGQEVSQVLQRIHSSALVGTDFFESGQSFRSWSSKTITGQVSTHVPQPLHFFQSTFIFGIIPLFPFVML